MAVEGPATMVRTPLRGERQNEQRSSGIVALAIFAVMNTDMTTETQATGANAWGGGILREESKIATVIVAMLRMMQSIRRTLRLAIETNMCLGEASITDLKKRPFLILFYNDSMLSALFERSLINLNDIRK